MLPLIHFVLLSYLPLAGMRACLRPDLRWAAVSSLWCAAMPIERPAATPQIRTTMHDGLLLPQLFRRHGLRTDLADLTHLATCRMYHNASEVWRGTGKECYRRVWLRRLVLCLSPSCSFVGQILPLLLALSVAVVPASYSGRCSHAHPGRAGGVVCASFAFGLEISSVPAQRFAASARASTVVACCSSGMPC